MTATHKTSNLVIHKIYQRSKLHKDVVKNRLDPVHAALRSLNRIFNLLESEDMVLSDEQFNEIYEEIRKILGFQPDNFTAPI